MVRDPSIVSPSLTGVFIGEAAEEEMQRGEGSDAYGLQISQLGEWVCDACLEGYLGGGFGDYSELRSGYVAPYSSNPWIGRSRDLSCMVEPLPRAEGFAHR